MQHVRRQIVLAVAALLRGRIATIADRVYEGRTSPVVASTGAHLLVYARREQSRGVAEDENGRRLQRELVLAIEGVTAGADDSAGDETLDAIALEVERILAPGAAASLAGLIKDIEIASTDLNARAEGESRTGRVRLEFTVEYHTTAAGPDRPLA